LNRFSDQDDGPFRPKWSAQIDSIEQFYEPLDDMKWARMEPKIEQLVAEDYREPMAWKIKD
jgi:hypothetical protein